MAHFVQRVAHRGGAQLAPENTLAAFRNALTLSVDAIELDVQMSADGYPLVFHDHRLERLTNGEGNILDLDFASAHALNAAAHFSGGWPEIEQIPTLPEVLALVKNRVQAYIEIKQSMRNGVYGRYPQIVETIVKDVKDAGMVDQVLLISFDWFILPQVKTLDARLQTGAIVSRRLWSPSPDRPFEALLAQIKTLGATWINLDYRLFTDDMVSAVHKQGMKIGLWTVNELAALRRFRDAGVDSLTTDRPDLFAEL